MADYEWFDPTPAERAAWAKREQRLKDLQVSPVRISEYTEIVVCEQCWTLLLARHAEEHAKRHIDTDKEEE